MTRGQPGPAQTVPSPPRCDTWVPALQWGTTWCQNGSACCQTRTHVMQHRARLAWLILPVACGSPLEGWDPRGATMKGIGWDRLAPYHAIWVLVLQLGTMCHSQASFHIAPCSTQPFSQKPHCARPGLPGPMLCFMGPSLAARSCAPKPRHNVQNWLPTSPPPPHILIHPPLYLCTHEHSPRDPAPHHTLGHTHMSHSPPPLPYSHL